MESRLRGAVAKSGAEEENQSEDSQPRLNAPVEVCSPLPQIQLLRNVTAAPSKGGAAVGALRGSGLHSDIFSSCLEQQSKLLSELTLPAKVNNFLRQATGTILICGPACLCASGRPEHRHLYELVWV